MRGRKDPIVRALERNVDRLTKALKLATRWSALWKEKATLQRHLLQANPNAKTLASLAAGLGMRELVAEVLFGEWEATEAPDTMETITWAHNTIVDLGASIGELVDACNAKERENERLRELLARTLPCLDEWSADAEDEGPLMADIVTALVLTPKDPTDA